MEKSKPLKKIDNCLMKYVEHNNLKYKRSISSIYMNKKELTQFYSDMANEGLTKYQKIREQKQSDKQKILHWKNKNHKKPFNAHQEMEIVPINHQNFIIENVDVEVKEESFLDEDLPNLEKKIKINKPEKFPQQLNNYLKINQSNNKVVKMMRKYKDSEQDIDKSDVKVFKNIEEQKYVNRFRVKEKKVKKEQQQENESPAASKRSKRLEMLFKKYFLQKREKQNQHHQAQLNEEVKAKMGRKKNIFNNIETYFIRKIGTHPFSEFQ